VASQLLSASGTAGDHSTVADATYGAGTSYDWANLGNVGASDNAYANAPGLTGTDNQTHRLDLKNWGFSIPSGATIDGIVATIEWRTSNNLRPLSEIQIRLLKAGSPTGSNKATYSNSSTASDAVDSHGGSSDLWGDTWDDTDVNATDFGICLQYKSDSSSSKNPFVDHVTLEVFYTEGGGGSIESGAGSSAGTSTAPAVGASTAAAVGSADGEATADGVGASIAAATGTSAGSATADGVGDSAESGIESGAGTSAGTSTADGVGASTAAAAGDSDGESTAEGAGASIAAAAGESAGEATADGVGGTAGDGSGEGIDRGGRFHGGGMDIRNPRHPYWHNRIEEEEPDPSDAAPPPPAPSPAKPSVAKQRATPRRSRTSSPGAEITRALLGVTDTPISPPLIGVSDGTPVAAAPVPPSQAHEDDDVEALLLLALID